MEMVLTALPSCLDCTSIENCTKLKEVGGGTRQEEVNRKEKQCILTVPQGSPPLAEFGPVTECVPLM